MAHSDTIEQLIPWYVNDTLSGEDRERFEAHLRTCETCRALLDEARRLEDLGSGGDLRDHVQAQHLERYAREDTDLPPDLREWVRTHLEECDACRGALGVLRHVVADPELSPDQTDGPAAPEQPVLRTPARHVTAPHPRPRRFFRDVLLHPAAAAVYLGALLLAVPLYRGLVHLPDVSRRLAAAQPPAARGGAVDLPVLSSVLRGEAEGPVVAVDPGRPLAPLALDLELPDGIAPDSSVELAILHEGVAAWSTSMAVSRIAANLDESGLVVLLVPSGALQAGSHRLTAVVDGAVLLDTPFEVTVP